MSGWIWFSIGAVIGTCFGVVLTAICVASRRNDEE